MKGSHWGLGLALVLVSSIAGCAPPGAPAVSASADASPSSVYGTWKATLTKSAVQQELTDAGLGDKVERVWGDIAGMTGGGDSADFWLYISSKPHVGGENENWHLLTAPDCRTGPCTMDGDRAVFNDDTVALTINGLPGVGTLRYKLDGDTLTFDYDSSTRKPSEEEYLRGLYASADWTRTDAPPD